MGAGASAPRDEELRQLRAERDELRHELAATRRKLDEATPHPPKRARSGLISPTRAHRSSVTRFELGGATTRSSPSNSIDRSSPKKLDSSLHGERVFGAASRIGRVVDVRRFSDDVAAYEAQIIPKEDRVRDVLWHAITSVALFRGLDEAHKRILTDPFDVVHCEAGDVVVREGDAGDRYYVVEKGEVRVFHHKNEREPALKQLCDLDLGETSAEYGVYTKSIAAGAGFGELALLHASPRNATVVCCGPCVLWALDRLDCKAALRRVHDGVIQKRVAFLREATLGGGDSTISLGSALKATDLARLAAEMATETFAKGEVIVRQGDTASQFFVVESGRVDVHVDASFDPSQRAPRITDKNRTKSINEGGHFGELALLSSELRTASVRASTHTKVLTLSRHDFERHLGHLEDVIETAHTNQSPSRRQSSSLDKSSLESFAEEECPLSTDDFDALEVVGTGHFGVVKRVLEKGTGRIFACKVQDKARVTDEAMEAYVVGECEVLASLSSPFIISLRACFQDKSHIYLILDLVEGGEIYEHLLRRVSFDEESLKFILAQSARALEHLHAKSIIYRDMKPENLVLDASGNVKLVDFGLAKVLRGSETKTWTMCGTSQYLAPEVLRSEGHGTSVDFWCFGVLCFELGNGRVPFSGADDMALYESILRMRPRYPRSFSSELVGFISKLLKPTTKRLYEWTEVRADSFFSGVDFASIHDRSAKSPLQQAAVERRRRIVQKRGDVVEAPLADSNAQKSDWAPRLPLAKRPWDEYDDDRERPTFDSWGSDDI